MNSKNRKCIFEYDKEVDIFTIYSKEKVESSMEIFDGQVIVDFNKKGEVVGFEFLDFNDVLKEGNKKLNKILNKILNKRKGGKKHE